GFFRSQLRNVESRILPNNGHGFVAAQFRRREQTQPSSLLRRVKCDLLIRWLEIFYCRQNPNLKEVDGLGFRSIELAVHDSAAGRHRLNFIRSECVLLPHAVAMQEPALKDVCENLHIAMRMRSKAPSRSDAII